jgi:pimeloyl-ACP methyl ester carboxylesterase
VQGFLVTMCEAHTDQRRWLRLADGRRIAYTETGPRGGRPVLYCHGAIGTPLGASAELEAITAELGVRYLALSRPGTGGSDPAPGRTLLSLAPDVRALADALELDRLDLIGVSAGGPYALALAHQLPELVGRVALCSSLSPLCAPHQTPGMSRRIRMALALLARAPGSCSALGDAALPVIARHPRLLSQVIAAHAAPGERARLADPAERAAASSSFLAAAEGGVRGMIQDYLTYARAWGFDVTEVTAGVQLWHGVCDPLVPVEHALQLAVALPDCRVFLDADEGHHFFRRRLRSILVALLRGDDKAGTGVASALARVQALEQREHRRRRLLVSRAADRAAVVADPDLQMRAGGDPDDAAAHLRDRLAG